MSVPLPSDLRRFVAEEIESGRYRSAEDVLCDAVRLLRAQKLHQLRDKVRAGADQLARGEATQLDGDEALRAFFVEIETEVHNEMVVEQNKDE